jgi:hypothetical protein
MKGFTYMNKNITPNSELAAYLSAVLKNPACPARIFNAIVDEIASMSEAIDTDEAEFIERALDAYAAKEEKRQQKS